MQNNKIYDDNDNHFFWIILLVMMVSIPFLSFSQTIQVRTPQEFSTALSNGSNVRIMCDTLDLTGVILPLVQSSIYGNNKKIIYKKLPSSGEIFMMTISNGSIDSCTIIGPNNEIMADGGYFGGIKISQGKITAVNFISCDKFGVYITGNRTSVADSTFINSCTFTGIKRNGYGYGIWNQYGTCIIRNSIFQQCRHFFDCSSEAWIYDTQYCTFTASHYNYGLHNHMYPDTIVTAAVSGAGFIFKNNYVFGTTIPYEGYRSKTGKVLFENNFFEAQIIGNISGFPIMFDTLIWKNNKINGQGMLQAPVITCSSVVKVGEKISFEAKGYSKLIYEEGKPPLALPTPRVKTYSCYGVFGGIRSITSYKSISVIDTGKYTGFYLKTYKCKVEVYKDGYKIAVISSPVWKNYLYRGNITFKIVSEINGQCLFDDWVKSGTAETFESTSNVKVTNYSTTKISVGRFIGDKLSGLWCLKFDFRESGSINIE